MVLKVAAVCTGHSSLWGRVHRVLKVHIYVFSSMHLRSSSFFLGFMALFLLLLSKAPCLDVPGLVHYPTEGQLSCLHVFVTVNETVCMCDAGD